MDWLGVDKQAVWDDWQARHNWEFAFVKEAHLINQGFLGDTGIAAPERACLRVLLVLPYDLSPVFEMLFADVEAVAFARFVEVEPNVRILQVPTTRVEWPSLKGATRSRALFLREVNPVFAGYGTKYGWEYIFDKSGSLQLPEPVEPNSCGD